MKSLIYTALLSVTVLACQATATQTETSKPTPEPQKPVVTTTPVETQKAPVLQQKKDETQTKKHRKVAERLFQLDDLQSVKIKIGKNEFNCWVMDEHEKTQEGMMHLEDTDFTDKDCMIFVFPAPQQLSFWMHNTKVDLDIAYVNEKKYIETIATMKSYDETGIPSHAPCQYAIEFKAGLLKKLGIKRGMKVEIPKTVVAKKEIDDNSSN